MRSSIPSLLLIAALVALGPVAVLGKDKKDKEKEKAYKEALSDFNARYRSEDVQVRLAVVKKLTEFADLGAAKLMVEKVLGKERSGAVLDAATQVVAGATDEKVVDWLVSKARGRGDWEMRSPLVEAMGYLKSEKADALLVSLLGLEKDPRVLSMALFGVGEKKLTEAFEKTLPHLEHEDWQVRVAAVEALARIGDEKAIDPLIDRLEAETGRLRYDIADALHDLTGRSFGRDVKKWREWRASGSPPKPPADDEPDPADRGNVYRKGPTYFGIPVVSERVLFIIDVSMSMKTPIDVDKARLAAEARTGVAAEREEKFEDTIEWWKIKDRLDLAKAQLKYVVLNLKKTQQFEIAAFSIEVEPWNGGFLKKASSKSKAQAVQFIDKLDVVEDTAAGAALDFAFEMAGPGASEKNYKTGVDTIFFLSDGAPSDRSPTEILDDVKRRNKLRKIKIHTIAILNYHVKFLRLLAEQNGGIYKFFKVEDK